MVPLGVLCYIRGREQETEGTEQLHKPLQWPNVWYASLHF
jgi:hypothetical protein